MGRPIILLKAAGGYGIYIENGTIRTFSGGQYVNTNSARMELMGALMALRKCDPGPYIHIHLDNQICGEILL